MGMRLASVPTVPFADLDGIRVAYEDTGGSAPAVVFSHGFLMDKEMFGPQVDALRGEFRCITWDERGFGETPAAGPFDYWDSARDCLGLLDHLGIDAAVLVGMSQGGFLAMRAALLAPERVRALALIDSQAGRESDDVRPAYDAMIEDWLANGPHDALAGVIASIIFGGGYDPAPWIAKWQATEWTAIREPYDALIGRDDIVDRLGEITCPAIVFHGEEDAANPVTKSEELRDGLADCVSLVVIPGAGHASNLSHPDAVNAPLLEFLRKYAQ
jgi:3-oxoadipate enol-lactonase